MIRQCRACGLAIASHDVEHAFRQSRFEEQLAEPDSDERRVLRRLNDDRVARRQRRHRLVERHGERIVRRRDAYNHAERLARGVIQELSRQRNCNRIAKHLRGPTRVVFRPTHRRRDFLLCLPKRLAVFKHDELREFVAMFLDQSRHLLQQPPAFVRSNLAPRSLERTPRRTDGEIHFRLAARWKLSNHLARCRIHNVDGSAVRRVAPLAANEHLRGLAEKRMYGG